jgi:hypothetical protein
MLTYQYTGDDGGLVTAPIPELHMVGGLTMNELLR